MDKKRSLDGEFSKQSEEKLYRQADSSRTTPPPLPAAGAARAPPPLPSMAQIAAGAAAAARQRVIDLDRKRMFRENVVQGIRDAAPLNVQSIMGSGSPTPEAMLQGSHKPTHINSISKLREYCPNLECEGGVKSIGGTKKLRKIKSKKSKNSKKKKNKRQKII
jgi:hypothetical protein